MDDIPALITPNEHFTLNELNEDHEEVEDDPEEWEEVLVGDGESPCVASCLLCPESYEDAMLVVHHMRECHQWDIVDMIKSHLINDCYDFIRFVNYVRKNKVLKHEDVFADADWKSEEYLQPFMENDFLLLLDVDDIQSSLEISPSAESNHNCAANDSDSSHRMENLEKQVDELKTYVHNLRRLLYNALNDDKPVPNSGTLNDSCDTRHLRSNDEDFTYFESYSHYSIHAEMLGDEVRTRSYQRFILNNGQQLFHNKRVLDVGCGTGILSLFAAQAGAGRVIGIDCADVLYQAMDIVRENGYENRITLMKGKLEEIEIPGGQVDVIISEWMGYCLLFESMFDSILYARDNLLSNNGTIYPKIFSMHAVAVKDDLSGNGSGLRSRNLDFWQNVYGFRMSCMRKCVIEEALVTVVPPHCVVSDAHCVKLIDMSSVTLQELVHIRSDLQLTVYQDCDVTAIVLYFDTDFDPDAQNKVSFSTSPLSTATHWKQTVLLLDKLISAKSGDQLTGSIEILRHRKSLRGLDIKLILGPNRQRFSLT